jgi:NAD(P)-dependent dehydrogenase (short-subunit alcohol dehydrogenase family)
MPWNVDGKLCMVTGANAGIGKKIALGLSGMGAHVIMVCRDPVRGREAQEEIRSLSKNDRVELLVADLSSQKQIRDLAADYKRKHNTLHVLVNNAGIVRDSRVLTEDGLEMTFAVNYLACFMLTNLLVDMLKASAPSRIVNLSSMVHRTVKLDFDNLQGERRYNRDVSYAQSKLADIIFSYELGRRLEGTGVTVNCVCPGAVNSNLWQNSSKLVNWFFRLFMKGPEEGAKLPMYLACSAEMDGITCRYFQTGQHMRLQHVNEKETMTESSHQTYNTEVASRLWDISEKLTGLAGMLDANEARSAG